MGPCRAQPITKAFSGLLLAALLAAFSGILLLLTGLLLPAALLLSWRLLTTLLLLARLLIAALILLNILVRIRHLKYLIVKGRQPAHNYELADYNR